MTAWVSELLMPMVRHFAVNWKSANDESALDVSSSAYDVPVVAWCRGYGTVRQHVSIDAGSVRHEVIAQFMPVGRDQWLFAPRNAIVST